MKLTHRDDLPFELAEEIVKKLKAINPDYEVRFAGDQPEGSVPPEIMQKLEELEQRIAWSCATGCCFDCGAQMPGFNEWLDSDNPIPEGWAIYESQDKSDPKDAPGFFVCPECDANPERSDDGQDTP